MEMKKMWCVTHVYDVDGGFGDAIPKEYIVGFVMATDSEIELFVEKWDKPVVYDKPYASLYMHGVDVTEVELFDGDISEFKPYDPDGRFPWE